MIHYENHETGYILEKNDDLWYIMFTENRFFFLVIGLLFILVLQLEEKENKIVRVVWRHPGDDVTGMAARSEKIVNTCEKVNI
jgi:hypothetical protein